jgi:Flp pilus assembly protein TadD
MNDRLLLALALLASVAGGCGHDADPDPTPYETIRTAPNRDTDTARALHEEATALIREGRLEQAEGKLRSALTADTFFGPAHNDLGIVYLRTKQHYLAAWEFQYAAKLMPDHKEPLHNLGMVYEAVGRFGEAAEWYNKALELAPESGEVAGSLARAQIRSNEVTPQTLELLQKVVMRHPDPTWVDWAREQSTLLAPKVGSEPSP